MRTTNDVEGWHTHLANHAGLSISSKGLNLYILLEVLYEEAIQVDIYTKMLEQGQQLRRQRKTFKELEDAFSFLLPDAVNDRKLFLKKI